MHATLRCHIFRASPEGCSVHLRTFERYIYILWLPSWLTRDPPIFFFLF